jgi:hypothetical protein
MKTPKKSNLGAILSLSGMVYFIYFLLITERLLPFSVSSVLNWSSHWSKQLHVCAVGLVPICLGFMIFGAAVFSLYFGSVLQRWISKFLS